MADSRIFFAIVVFLVLLCCAFCLAAPSLSAINKKEMLEVWCEMENTTVTCERLDETSFCIGSMFKNEFFRKTGDKRIWKCDTTKVGATVLGFSCESATATTLNTEKNEYDLGGTTNSHAPNEDCSTHTLEEDHVPENTTSTLNTEAHKNETLVGGGVNTSLSNEDCSIPSLGVNHVPEENATTTLNTEHAIQVRHKMVNKSSQSVATFDAMHSEEFSWASVGTDLLLICGLAAMLYCIVKYESGYLIIHSHEEKGKS